MSRVVNGNRPRVIESRVSVALAIAFLASVQAFAQPTFFTPGNVVVAVSGCGVMTGPGVGCAGVTYGAGSVGGYVTNYGDNQGSPLTLLQFTPAGTYVNALVLPQTGSGANFPVSAEYGSSSEGTLQSSGNKTYLTVGGYGINAAKYNFSPLSYTSYINFSKARALAQTSSLTGFSWTPVPRVVALIDANGNVNSTTALYNVFDQNNIRSTFTADGTSVYVSGQGSTATENGTSGGSSTLDATGGVFYSPTGAVNTAPTTITGTDAGSGESQESNEVQISNNTLYVSSDSKEGSFNRSFVGTLGSPPATSLFTCTPNCATGSGTIGPAEMSGFGNTGGTGKVTLTTGASSNGNNLNNTSALKAINLSPMNYFFASPTVLYVADSGHPKNDSNNDDNSNSSANIGDGGLQKWVFSSGSWSLKYTLYQGLNLVNNGSASGTTGLYGLAGVSDGTTATLYATNFTLSDLDQTYLYGISDTLSNSTPPGASQAFTLLATAPADSNFKGVAVVPTTPANSVELVTSPSGLAISSVGAGCAPGSYTAPTTLVWTPNSTCQLSVSSPQPISAGVQYALNQWQDGTTNTADSVAFSGSSAGSPVSIPPPSPRNTNSPPRLHRPLEAH